MRSETLKAIQVLALAAVESPTYEDTIRSLRRWYSQTLHVDYTRMDEIPDEVVIQDYLEETYKKWYESDDPADHKQYDQARAMILQRFEKTEGQVTQEDDDWVKEELAKVQAADTAKAKPTAPPKKDVVAAPPPEPETPNLLEEGSVMVEDTIPE